MNEDWDNLILLDACRYDIFEHQTTLEGRLESRISKGSASKEFILENFSGRELHDTIYITANPFVGLIESNVFHAVITLLDEWDSDLQTVAPEKVVDATEEACQSYENKRIIVHFMQPHQPYLGEKSEYITSKIEESGNVRGYDNTIRESVDEKTSLDGIKQLEAPKHPEIDVTRKDIWEAYCESFEIVLEHVKELVDLLDGKTVISADHGELIGENRSVFDDGTFGHPSGNWSRKLRQVPWFVIESNNRREITPESPERYDKVNENKLDEKLEALGYK